MSRPDPQRQPGDDSPQRAAEEELALRNAELERRLAERGAELERGNRQQELFAYGISHDLRAPLRAIESFAALLDASAGAQLDDAGRDHLARIRGAAARMSVLIDALLALSRASRVELRPAPVDLSMLADWALAELQDAEPTRAAEIVVQPGLAACGDERQLKQLLDQLLHNAWKFSRDRDRVRIEVGGECRDGRMRLSVRDQGSGFEMRYAQRVFEPFQRLHGAEEGGGSGLGLAIVQRVAERHGGRVWAESAPGEGSVFHVELPAVDGGCASDEDAGPGGNHNENDA